MIEHGPLLERLLAGDFICAVSDDNAYRHLANEEIREAMLFSSLSPRGAIAAPID